MGQAFDRDGNVLGEANGATKAEVLAQLERNHPDAEAIIIQKLKDKMRSGPGIEAEARSRAYIDKPFAYHKPSDDGFKKITELRQAFSAVKASIEANCPPSRQTSVAITELETAAMWAIKAVVFNDPKSEAEQVGAAVPATA